MVFMEDENDEDLTYLTLLNAFYKCVEEYLL